MRQQSATYEKSSTPILQVASMSRKCGLKLRLHLFIALLPLVRLIEIRIELGSVPAVTLQQKSPAQFLKSCVTVETDVAGGVEVFHTASPIQDVEKFSRAAALVDKVRVNSIEGNEVLRIGSLTRAERLE